MNMSKLSETSKEIILRFANIQDTAWGDAPKTVLDGTHTDDIIELYLLNKDARTPGLTIHQKCSNVHDGWAIARIIEFTESGCNNYVGKADKLDMNGKHKNKAADSGRFTTITLDLPELHINTVIRGDQLLMFVDYMKLTEAEATKDQAAVIALSSLNLKISEYNALIEDMDNAMSSAGGRASRKKRTTSFKKSAKKPTKKDAPKITKRTVTVLGKEKRVYVDTKGNQFQKVKVGNEFKFRKIRA
jgi:hypothetical protein